MLRHSVLLWAVVLSGCSTIAPQTAALEEVHQIYRDDFRACGAIIVERTESETNCTFQATRDAIADYRERYPGNTAELNHLTVLEGMTYLREHHFGLAAAMKEDVERAGTGLTSATGVATRDKLLAENFGHMIDGWQVWALPEPSREPELAMEQIRESQAAAEGIVDNLCRSRADGRLGQISGNQGATYLAATAGRFMLDVDQRALDGCSGLITTCTFGDPDYDQCFVEAVEAAAVEGAERQPCAMALQSVVKAEWTRRARDTMATFLPDRERTVLVCATSPDQATAMNVDCASDKNWEAALEDLDSKAAGPSPVMTPYRHFDQFYKNRVIIYQGDDMSMLRPQSVCPP